jgi:cytochrome c-type biogenesis protein CcmH/NrfG
VSALETDMSKQAEAMNQLREYSLRTEDNLSRLITGVDKLSQELPKRLAAAEPTPQPVPEPRLSRRKSHSFSPKIFWIAVAAIIVIVVAAFQVPKLWSRGKSAASPSAAASVSGGSAPGEAAPAAAKPSLQAGADTKTKLQAAEEYTDHKDYPMAEDIYKQVLKAEPNNVDAMKALASVLYREDKIEESAAILDKLPKTN